MQRNREFIRVVKENEGMILKIVKVYTADLEQQKDLYQEIVYQLWKSFSSYRGEAKISTWIYRIALNCSYTHLQSIRRRGTSLPLDFDLIDQPDEHGQLIEEQMERLYCIIRKLNPIDKGIILLSLEGLNYDEIASITGFSESNVGTRLNRIRKKLKTQIKNV